MKVLLLNGSARKGGCTYLALSEVAKALNEQGVETEIVQLGGGPVRDCVGCNGCAGKGQCVFGDDMVNGPLLFLCKLPRGIRQKETRRDGVFPSVEPK